jgi:uncharacterized protein (DUF58 family)
VKLQLPVAGRWYFGLMFMLGAVSLTSSNNVVYLMEALLISGLLVSATLAVQTVRSVTADVRRRPIQASGANQDQIRLVNRSRFPIFCLEVDEWSEGKAKRLAFVPFIKARSTLMVPCKAVYEKRGTWAWDAISVGTTFPYGFLRFLKRFQRPGMRIVWPAATRATGGAVDRTEGQSSSASGSVFLEGEVRPMNDDDDPRSIVWTLSARGGDLMVRMRASETQVTGLNLDLRAEPGEVFEAAISELASKVYESPAADSDSFSLSVVDRDGKKRIFGRSKILDCLALARAEGAEVDQEAG